MPCSRLTENRDGLEHCAPGISANRRWSNTTALARRPMPPWMRGSGSQIPHHWLVAVDVFNHRQRELELWNDIEYYYVSR